MSCFSLKIFPPIYNSPLTHLSIITTTHQYRMKRRSPDAQIGASKRRRPSPDSKATDNGNGISPARQNRPFATLPYDLRFILWKNSLQDSSKVVKATARIFPSIHVIRRAPCSDLLLKISPSKGIYTYVR